MIITAKVYSYNSYVGSVSGFQLAVSDVKNRTFDAIDNKDHYVPEEIKDAFMYAGVKCSCGIQKNGYMYFLINGTERINHDNIRWYVNFAIESEEKKDDEIIRALALMYLSNRDFLEKRLVDLFDSEKNSGKVSYSLDFEKLEKLISEVLNEKTKIIKKKSEIELFLIQKDMRKLIRLLDSLYNEEICENHLLVANPTYAYYLKMRNKSSLQKPKYLFNIDEFNGLTNNIINLTDLNTMSSERKKAIIASSVTILGIVVSLCITMKKHKK